MTLSKTTGTPAINAPATRHSRTILILLVAVCFANALISKELFAQSGSATTGAAVAVAPNIIVVELEGIRHFQLGCYGATDSATPNIDRLASEGLTFNNAYRDVVGENPIALADVVGDNKTLRALIKQLTQTTVGPNSARPKGARSKSLRCRVKLSAVDVTTDGLPTATAAGLLSIDYQVGQLIAAIESQNRVQDTLLILSSGNGATRDRQSIDGAVDGAIDSVTDGAAGGVYENDLRIPLIVRWSGRVAPGQTSDLPVTHADIAATVFDIVNMKTNKRTGGRTASPISFVAEMFQRTDLQQPREWLIWNDQNSLSPRGAIAVRSGDWKLLRNNNDQPWELYHLESDAEEKENLAGERPDLVKRMEQLLIANAPAEQSITHQTQGSTPPIAELRRSTIGQVIAKSEQRFKGIAFEEDAILMGLIRAQDDARTLHLNMVWDLQPGRRAIRFIHVCNAADEIIAQIQGDAEPFLDTETRKQVLDYVTISAEQIQQAHSIKIGFYAPDRKNAIVADGSGIKKWRFEIWKRE